MDNGGDGILPVDGDDIGEANLSDVLDAINKADPQFEVAVGAMPRPLMPLSGVVPFVRIVEEPASKALRFRYECEGRSAGSIPGVNSTQERKTYPTIEICGHRGPAIVVVSCVTKDEPYKPHPHNLVGRDRCDKGVCTVKTVVTDDAQQVTFSNLGIQCVKRKDIAEALRVREGLRVDPFKTGFSHRNQPQSIDLNAVRLCFQVFIQDEESKKIRHSLPPVVSEVIYDKKAISELAITRLSQCSAPLAGGTEIILLCDRVTREDISVVFFEKQNGGVVWEEAANVLLVHRQVAIVFNAPPYRDPRAPRNVQVFLQLKRPSDNTRSEPVPFEYIPDYQGIPRKPLADLSVFSLLLERRDTNNNNNSDDDKQTDIVSSTGDPVPDHIEPIDVDPIEPIDLNGNDIEEPMVVDNNEKSFNDLLEQVAELDEIYSENRTRIENAPQLSNDNETDLEDFNDAGTYTSLQLAFKNPIHINEPEPYEDVQVQTYRGPIIEFTQLKRDTEEERAPPLPPKRVRKTTEPFKTSQTSVDSILKPGKQLPITRKPDNLSPNRIELTVAKSEPNLPPEPKKRSFFSRLFRRREKSPAPSVKSEGKKEVKTKSVGRSVSSVSGIRPSKFKSSVSHTSLKDNASGTGLSYADSVTHISLHGDGDDKSTSQTSLKRPASLAPIPPTDGGTILVAESVLALDASAFKKLQDDLDLTDAEHYALYMAVAPHATVSEFDETSCYYSPIDGNSSYLKHKRQKTISNFVHQYEQDRGYQDSQIKSEPRDKTPPHKMGSPLQIFSPSYTEHEQVQSPYQQWINQPLVGPSHYGQELGWAPAYGPPQPPQGLAALAPMPVHLSPNMGHVSPTMGHVSPTMGHVSPTMGHVSPGLGHVSPNLVQQQQQQQQQQQCGEEAMESSPSLSGLLRGGEPPYTSGELSGLAAMFPGPDLSDSLNRLSTSDLLHP